MTYNFHIVEIVRYAHKSLYTDINGNRSGLGWKLFLFDILPLLLAVLLIWLGNDLSVIEEISTYLFTTLSLFAGLLFSLIVVIVDKAKSKKLQITSQDEEVLNYYQRYMNFSEQLITQISFTILLSLGIILFLFGKQLEVDVGYSFHAEVCKWTNRGLDGLIYYFSFQFLIMLLIIISGMYSVFLDELKED